MAELKSEIDQWKDSYVDVELIADKLLKVSRENIQLRSELGKLQGVIRVSAFA